MKRYKSSVLPVLLALLLMGGVADAQFATWIPRQQSQGDNPGNRWPGTVWTLRASRQQLQQGGGARSASPGQRSAGGGGRAIDLLNGAGRLRAITTGGAWWTNTALVERLGLTEDQKTKIEKAFENHRERIVSGTDLLNKEEAQLARLLEAEPIDKSAVLTQTDRVIQARGELERTNAAMTLEMREVLTRAQWMQVPQPVAGQTPNWAAPGVRWIAPYFNVPAGERGAAPAPTPAPPAPGQGGRRGGGQRQQ